MSEQLLATLTACAEEIVDAAKPLSRVVALLTEGVEVPRAEIDSAVERAVDAGRRLRAAVTAAARELGDTEPVWASREALASLVAELRTKLEMRSQNVTRKKLQFLAEELQHGTVQHRLSRTKERLDELRKTAAHEVEAAGVVAELAPPWPTEPVVSWVHWFCGLEGIVADRHHLQLEADFPAVAAFVSLVESSTWVPPDTQDGWLALSEEERYRLREDRPSALEDREASSMA